MTDFASKYGFVLADSDSDNDAAETTGIATNVFGAVSSGTVAVDKSLD